MKNELRHEIIKAYYAGIITYAELIKFCNDNEISLYYEIKG